MKAPAQVTPNQRARLSCGVADPYPVGAGLDVRYRSTYRQVTDEIRVPENGA